MRVAIIASPEVDFYQMDRILPRSTKEIMTDGTGPTERNVHQYCQFTEISYREFPPKPDPFRIKEPGAHLMKMIELADLVIILWHAMDYKPGRAMSAALIDKMVHCYFVQGRQLHSLIPHPVPA